MTDIVAQDWTPDPKCCWCSQRFQEREIMGLTVFVCPTPACLERCMVWAEVVDNHLLFLPLPKQAELFEIVESHRYRQILWGGPLGGAKSFGLRHLAYHYCRTFQNFHTLLLRRTYPQLEGSHIIDTVREIAALNACFAKPVAKYASRRIDFFETSAILKYGHCQDPEDYESYLSAAFDLIIFDQLETFEDKQHREISARTGRIRRAGWKGTVLSGENPGGPGAAFIDELFITKNRDRKKYPKYNPDDYAYFPASLSDNPYIDTGYESFIGDLDEAKREMYRFGRRDVFPNQYFKDFVHPLRVQQLDVPTHLPRLGALHWGYFTPGIMLWLVALPDGRLYVEREFAFEEQLATTIATDIVSLNAQRDITVSSTWGNPPEDVPEAQTGEDPFESMYRAGFTVRRSKHDPVSGWQRLRHWFAVTDTQAPAMIIDPSCETLLKTVPFLLQSPTNPEDCYSAAGLDAAAKALRYLVMSRPARSLSAFDKPSRDLSNFDAKTQADISRMTSFEKDERGKDMAIHEAGYPFGDGR